MLWFVRYEKVCKGLLELVKDRGWDSSNILRMKMLFRVCASGYRGYVLAWNSKMRGFLSLPYQVLAEADLNRSGTINEQEFRHIMSKSPDFAYNFRFRI